MSKCRTDSSGNKIWRNYNGEYHREDGPAIEWAAGDKSWWINGLRHRLDGPAIEYISGYKEWWYNGNLIECDSQEEFLRLVNLKSFW